VEGNDIRLILMDVACCQLCLNVAISIYIYIYISIYMGGWLVVGLLGL